MGLKPKVIDYDLYGRSIADRAWKAGVKLDQVTEPSDKATDKVGEDKCPNTKS